MTISSGTSSGGSIIKKEGIPNSPISSYNKDNNNNNNSNNNGSASLYQRYSSSLDKPGNMITQQRLPVHLEYLQTHIPTTESKASPLALLAATCSSIGKTDNDDSNVKTTSTSILNKLSTSQHQQHHQQQQQKQQDEDSKPSFKPYKLDVSPSVLRSSTAASLTSSDLSSNLSSTSSVPSTRVAPDLEREKRFYPADTTTSTEYPAPLKCHSTSPTLPHLGSSKSPYVHGHGHSHSHRDHHMECVQCNTMRPHSDPLPIINRTCHVTTGATCTCPMCHQARDSMKHHYQGPGGGSGGGGSQLYPPSYKSSPNFGPLITCRDPNCTNCSKFSHTNFQNFLHPALIHQCTHNTSTTAPPYKSSSYPVPPPPSHVPSPYDPYAKSPGTKPYVCNWVADGKHCGNTFVSSEELFQHLRTHTNSQQQANHCDKTHENPGVVGAPPPLLPQSAVVPPNVTCNIHGCPCGASQRKTSPSKHGGHGPYGSSLELSRRYTPYSRMMPSSGNSVGGHSYPPHSLYHY